MRLRVPTAVVALATVLVCGGCGLGPGAPTKGVSLTVTGAFGNRHISTVSRSKVPGSEPAMRMLERSFKISTRYGGGFVESINGLAPNAASTDWFYYVNGVQASKGAATTAVHAGDHIWWDLHNWSATQNIPAVVGRSRSRSPAGSAASVTRSRSSAAPTSTPPARRPPRG